MNENLFKKNTPPPRQDYEVGFGKPPVAGQFKPGRSGNPKGRPKGNLGFSAVVKQIMEETMYVQEGSRRRRYSKGEIVVRKILNETFNGDQKAAALLLAIIKSTKNMEPERQLSDPDEAQRVSEQDAEIVSRLFPTTGDEP